MVLTQDHYMNKILERFNKNDTNIAKTPVDVNLHLRKNTGDTISQVKYSRIIGTLMYMINCTRPDIAYSVSKLSRFTSDQGQDH